MDGWMDEGMSERGREREGGRYGGMGVWKYPFK